MKLAVLTSMAAFLALAGCETEADIARQQEQALEAFNKRAHARCVEYGLEPGTAVYADCRLRLNELRVQVMEARRNAALGILLSRPQPPAYTPAPMTPMKPPKPTVNTDCYTLGGHLHCTTR